MTILGYIRAPVGMRWRTQNVTNNSGDQKTIISLLAAIPKSQGGKKEEWAVPPLAGPDHNCPGFVADAIWDFQVFWKKKGVFHVIDGVVDPGNHHTIQQMTALANGQPLPTPPVTPHGSGVIGLQRIPGTWQVTNVWSAALGEVGQVGTVDLEITQPDNRKFTMRGYGAGFGYGIDPIGYLKMLKNAKSVDGPLLEELITMIGSGIGFNIGDYLQKLGVSLPSVTGGRIIANPLNGSMGRPTQVTRYLLTEAGKQPFVIMSAGGGIGAGMEGGVICFGIPTGILSKAFAIYGSSGVTAKVGIGAQAILYSLESVTDA